MYFSKPNGHYITGRGKSTRNATQVGETRNKYGRANYVGILFLCSAGVKVYIPSLLKKRTVLKAAKTCIMMKATTNCKNASGNGEGRTAS
jgi:hypothetical protein